MKLSEILAQRLENATDANIELMRVNEEVLKTNAALAQAVVQGMPDFFQQTQPEEKPKRKLSPHELSKLNERLELARAAKLDKQKQAEEKRAQMLKNLAKARKAKKKK